MTITAPLVDEEQGWPDNGSSLLADPWSDSWALPTADELKAVGWPGARPGSSNPEVLQEVREPLSPDPHPTTVEATAEPKAQMSPPGALPPPPAPSL